MKNNRERGGIISSLVMVPAALALLIGVFLLGYYMGRSQCRQGESAGNTPPLPDIVSKNLPKAEDFTFYKTLTDKENRTVSIDLKPRAAETGTRPEKKAAPEAATEKAVPNQPGSAQDSAIENKSAPRQTAGKTVVTLREKKTASPRQAVSAGPHYTVQISSHQDRETAEEDVRRMKQNGFAAYIVTSNVSGRGTWYRVRLGSFTSKVSAEKLQKEVRTKAGVSPIVVIE